MIAFAVRDHGRGIPVELRNQVIMPFGRGPAPTSGTGLGLSVVRKFATGQGGELVIDDAEPGFRMVLRIPVDPPIA
jgi:signal transduction histidine kinase